MVWERDRHNEQLGNVAARLNAMARQRGSDVAIAVPRGTASQGTSRPYESMTFAELDQASSAVALGLQQRGLRPGQRIAMLVPFNADFILLVFALLKAGAVIILIDPGMGRKNLIRCLQEAEPEGFVAIPVAHLVCRVLRRRFPRARLMVTVGRRWGWPRYTTLESLRQTPHAEGFVCERKPDDPAAIIFTTGSTGPPKGVLYTHQTFHWQIDLVRERYQIEPGGKDLSGFPLFGLFNAVMGTTTIIPDMNPTRPADVDPPRLLDAIDQWQIDQAFGSPALWTAVGRYCERTGRRVPSLRRVLSAGAPVPPRVLRWMRQSMHPDGVMFTPYGATEALPIASIESGVVLEETAAASATGAGTCVGDRFPEMEWKVIAIDDGPAETIEQVRELPRGEIGELMVSGPVVSTRYVTRVEQNALHKVQDGERIWHRMGDIGYLDVQDRFWFVGRKSHRVRTAQGELYTIPCEAIYNQHPRVHRSALVGIGPVGSQTPVIIVELWPDQRPQEGTEQQQLIAELRALGNQHRHTATIDQILIHPGRLPTDIRHNAKIFRERLAPWAAEQLARTRA